MEIPGLNFISSPSMMILSLFGSNNSSSKTDKAQEFDEEEARDILSESPICEFFDYLKLEL